MIKSQSERPNSRPFSWFFMAHIDEFVLSKGQLRFAAPFRSQISGLGYFSAFNVACALVICWRLRSASNALAARSLVCFKAAIFCCSGVWGVFCISLILITVFSAVSPQISPTSADLTQAQGLAAAQANCSAKQPKTREN